MNYALLFTVCLGLLAHAFAFFNLNPSHDALYDFFSSPASHEWQMSLGRVLVPLYHKLTVSRVVLPWSLGALSLVWTGLAVFLTALLFDLRGRAALLGLSGIFVTNRTIIALTASYLPWLGADTCSLLLAAGAALNWRLFTQKRKWYFLAAGGVLTALSLGLYQAFLPTIITLIMLRSMTDLLQGKPGAAVLADGLWGVGILAGGLLLYLALMTGACRAFGVTIQGDSYDTLDVVWKNPTPPLERLIRCYRLVASKFLKDVASAYPPRLVAGVNTALFLFSAGASLLLLLRRKITGLALGLFVLLAAALPLGANIMSVVSTETHDLMYFALWLFWLLPLLLLRELSREEGLAGQNPAAWGLALCMAFLFYANIQTANLVYVKKQAQFEATQTVMTNVVYDLHQIEGYVEGETPVAFVGTPNDYLVTLTGTERVLGITGAAYTSPIAFNYDQYFRYVLLRPIPTYRTLNPAEIEAVQHLSVYPQPGYAALVGDTVYVRFQ